ncbi:MAG: T9SS type A sorting domain-containing protein, partial [Candidatus Marinimicrobia bacterium]|nr:T9SS type A sorting domain-containing protein [Candidatus Neomarinimicrobiota bacterium]
LAGEDYLNGGRIAGGSHGDIDGDGNPDFVFGSRYAGPPNGMLVRVEYIGGTDDVTNPANWELTIADTAAGNLSATTAGIFNVIDIANVDEDEADEVVYTSSTPYTNTLAEQVSFPIYILDSGDYTTDVHGIFQPASFELGTAYPNPFNPATVIPFTLESAGKVSLTVFNTNGERVATIISNAVMEAGRHNVMFDASDLTSGVYFYQLRVNNTLRAGKMVLTK